VRLRGIFHKADNGIAMIEQGEEFNMEYYFGSEEVRIHLVLCIKGDFPMWPGVTDNSPLVLLTKPLTKTYVW